jgi:hypothetical protein
VSGRVDEQVLRASVRPTEAANAHFGRFGRSDVRQPERGPGILTLHVTVSASSASIPAGCIVDLIYGGQVLGTEMISVINGVATASFQVAVDGRGSIKISADYVGAGSVLPSDSNSLRVRAG